MSTVSTDQQATARYVRHTDRAEVYDTDERGPHIKPIKVIFRSTWHDADTGDVITDQATIERLERENPLPTEAGNGE